MSSPAIVSELERLWIELEWRKCAEDPFYFISTYIWIESERDARGREPFELFDYQLDSLEAYMKKRFVVILKARQLGFTTLAMAYALWQCLFKPRANILLISKSQDSADKNLGMARFMYSFLPDWLKTRGPELDGDAAKQMVFKYYDGTINRLKSFAGTKTAGAGETASLVILDEFALMEDPASTYRTIKPTTDAGGRLIIISTARGGNNMFAKIYRDAKRGNNEFHAIFQPWTSSRLITPEQYEIKKREFIAEPWLFFAEYPSTDEEAFRESGRPRFTWLPDEASLDEYYVHGSIVDTPTGYEFVAEDYGQLHLAYPPEAIEWQRQFVIACDPSLGTGNDYSAVHILQLHEDGTPEIIGYYANNTIEPAELATELDLMGRYFVGANQISALLVIENAGGVGISLIDKLRNQLHYPNLYRYIPPAVAKRKRAPVFGFPTTKATKPLIINRLAEYIVPMSDNSCRLLNVYPKLREELSTYVRRENGTTAADIGCHDDLVISLAIGLYVLLEEVQPVGNNVISERVKEGEFRLDLTELYREANVIQKIENKSNRRFWANHRRAVRKTQRRNNRGF
jgi:hypothetical protein